MHGRLVATVATPADARLSSDDVVCAMPAFFGPADRAPQVARTDTTQVDSFVVTLAGISVAVLSFPFRIPDEALASALQNELLWRGAADAFRAAAGHVVLAVVGPSHDPQQSLQQARVLTIVTAAVLTSTSGRGVFWSPADTVIEPDRFKQEASDWRGSHDASPLWFSFRFFPGAADSSDQSLVCQSTGLAHFLGRELQCGPYRMPPAEMAPIVLFVARYMASAGPTFGDGHTFGFGEDSKSKDARLAFATSRRSGVERPIFRLELAAQESPAG
jgi:hypothetical protein